MESRPRLGHKEFGCKGKHSRSRQGEKTCHRESQCLCAGEELLMLAQALPEDRHIVGMDIAEGMVALATQRIACAGLRFESGLSRREHARMVNLLQKANTRR
jgi:hypothetical protein